ncbi:unnamed protein product [Bursaphelenchus okinawaensis]|uniref:C2H2-type domain-containing protein n=1 Tax=Bursaphelenchus okinawaensis TaxID=465554 RepID=A0A811KYE5_9BILA|nr:unnamed protein product [Bursaphelenchus okinawaensis]CAG9114552.1 unnamed protein product [Bursaphelenchus okinawaensis]
MNTLSVCQYENCGSRFETHFDQIAHFEINHYADAKNKVMTELNSLQAVLEMVKDEDERIAANEKMNAFYGQAIQMSLLRKLQPFNDNYIPRHEVDKIPIKLNFCNYKKRPPSAVQAPASSQKRQSVPNKRLTDFGVEAGTKVENATGEERKYKCTMEGCNRAYKNSNGLRSHLKSVHNVQNPQVRAHSPAMKPEPPLPTSTPQKFIQPIEPKSEEKVQPQFRGGSRMTPNEENILSRVQILNEPSADSPVPSPAPKKEKKTEKNYACDMCTKSYKTASNLRKHMADQHGKTAQNPAIDHRQPQRVNYTLGQPVQNAMPGTMANATQNMAVHSPRPQVVQQRLPQSPLTQGHQSPRNVQQVLHSPQPATPQRTYSPVTPRYEGQQQYVQQIQYTSTSSPQPSSNQYEEQYSSPGGVTVVMSEDQRNGPRNYSPQYDRYTTQPIRRLSGQKVQQTHPYYNPKQSRPTYQQGHQMEYVRTAPVPPSTGPIRGSQLGSSSAQPQTNYTQQPHYGQRTMMNNYEARPVRRTPQQTASGNLSAQLAPLNVGQSQDSPPQVQMAKVQPGLYTGPRTNMPHRQIAHQPVAGSSIRARFDPSRTQPTSQHFYQSPPGQQRYIQPQFSQRVIRVASTPQNYTSPPQPSQENNN